MEAINQLYEISDKYANFKNLSLKIWIICIIILLGITLLWGINGNNSNNHLVLTMPILSICLIAFTTYQIANELCKTLDYSDNKKPIMYATADYISDELTCSRITDVKLLSETEDYTEIVINYINDVGPRIMTVRLNPGFTEFNRNETDKWNVTFEKYYEDKATLPNQSYYSKIMFYYPKDADGIVKVEPNIKTDSKTDYAVNYGVVENNKVVENNTIAKNSKALDDYYIEEVNKLENIFKTNAYDNR